jgi:hypothetical protein
MRSFFYFLAAAAVLCLGVFKYLKVMSVDGQGITIAQSLRLAGVRRSLLHIAETEHTHITTKSECLSLDELSSAEPSENLYSERNGYVYSIECSASDFNVFARHAPPPPDSHLRFPDYLVDQTMKVRELN